MTVPKSPRSFLCHRLAILACLASLVCFGIPYSWQETQAGVTPSGDLVWQPRPFVYEAGSTVRYIDYEGGNDSNAGTMDAPWKHHPWDASAAGNAAAFSGPATYVFKRGVVYRGTLTPDDTGAAGNPIRLTSDPDWGSGEAMLYASEAITSGWERGGHQLMPNSNMVWHIDLPFAPRRVWLVEGASIQRLALARTPNWAESNPDDVKSTWWKWQSVNTVTWGGQSTFKGTDSLHLTQPAAYYSNAIVWTEFFPVMGSPYAARVLGFDSGTKSIFWRHPFGWGPVQHSRFFIEDMPQYLDATNEFWFDKTGSGGRLYVRLPDDREPNGLQIEAARHMNQINSPSISYLEISGLSFRFNNAFWDLTAMQSLPAQDVLNAAIRVTGGGTDIAIRNCTFEHGAEAVRILSDRVYNTLDKIAITDNSLAELDHAAMTIDEYGGTPPYGAIRKLDILRNRVYRIGMRPDLPSHGHAVSVNGPETAEIAGNTLDRIWGSALFVFGGKPSGVGGREVPLTRILIHHNRVTDALLTCNDWGAIETWQGGPFYLYGNISGNPGGFWNPSYTWGGSPRFGFAFYLDGSFKNYVFNNVAWGKNNTLTSPLCNLAAFQSVFGFQNVYFNNTVYKFAIGIRRDGEQTGRNAYLGNIWSDFSDIHYCYYQSNFSDSQYDYRNLAFARNIYHLPAPKYAKFEASGTTHTTFDSFRNALTARKTSACSLGQVSTNTPMRDAPNHDFRPADGSVAINAGARQFVPWALHRMFGEWHFRLDNVDPCYIQDENWFMTTAYTNRENYYQTPRLHLTATNVSADDYAGGPLENWCSSALQFNGSTRYASVKPLTSGLTLDPGTNGLIVEVYFKTVPDHTGGVIVSKLDAWNGYALEINEHGTPAMR
ncbi:hypothetical protein GX586_03720, partial [bacterium]|nr:hypothetical protein [bacterium]